MAQNNLYTMNTRTGLSICKRHVHVTNLFEHQGRISIKNRLVYFWVNHRTKAEYNSCLLLLLRTLELKILDKSIAADQNTECYAMEFGTLLPPPRLKLLDRLPILSPQLFSWNTDNRHFQNGDSRRAQEWYVLVFSQCLIQCNLFSDQKMAHVVIFLFRQC